MGYYHILTHTHSTCTHSVSSAIDDELFLFGGLETEGSFTCAEGVYVFKTSSQSWERCVTSGDPPRSLSLSASVHGHRLVLFGGVLDGEAHNDTHILDTSEFPPPPHTHTSQTPHNLNPTYTL